MGQLDPQLKALLRERQKRHLTTVAPEGQASPAWVRILIKFRDDLEPIKALGFELEVLAGDIAGGRAPLDKVEALAAHANVVKIEMSRPLFSELDTSVREVKADHIRSIRSDHTGWDGLTGRGVIMGIIDSGINYQHRSFRNLDADRTTRILWLWDQTLEPQGSESSPAPFPNVPAPGGVEYDQNAINHALQQSNPLEHVRHKDSESGHGSHVAGIAAGNGSQDDSCDGEFTFAGIAPEAELIIVRLDSSGTNDALGESVNLLAAIRYIFHRAGTNPAVINISQGDNLGPHDGTSMVEQGIDNILAGSTGRAIVKSAGNEGNTKRHAEGTVPGNGQLDLKFKVKSKDKSKRILDLWYEGGNRLDATVIPDGGLGIVNDASLMPIAPGDTESFEIEGGSRFSIASQANDVDNGDNNIQIILRRGDDDYHRSGTWTLRLFNRGADPVAFHCWIERGTDTPEFDAEDDAAANPRLSKEVTLNIPGTSNEVIAVANYVVEGGNNGELAGSSSRGPTRDGRSKPDLAAPGSPITSVRGEQPGCCERTWCQCCRNYYVDKGGTSMAAPHVSGAIALMLEKDGGLSLADIRSHLTATARDDSHTGTALPNNEWGAGKLDVEAAVNDVPTPPAVRTRSLPPRADFTAVGMPAGVFARSETPLQILQHRFLNLPGGRFYAALAEKHFDEIRTLVNTNKRVAVVWHRNGGPLLLRQALRAINNIDEPFPKEIEGLSVRERLERIIAIIRRHGSELLNADLETHAAALWAFEGMSINQMLERLEHSNILGAAA